MPNLFSSSELDALGAKLGRAAYENAFEGDEPLAKRIFAGGAVDPDREIEFTTELLVWSFFTFHVMLRDTIPATERERVTAAMIGIGRLADAAMRKHNGVQEINETKWNQLISDRFHEYDELLPVVDSRGPVKLAGAVSRRLTGGSSPDPTVALPILVTLQTTRKHVTPGIKTMWDTACASRST